MKTDGIILDIDGTIWNTTPIVAKAWNSAIEEICPALPRVSAEILQTQFGKPMNVIADNLFKGITDSERKQLLEECCIREQKAIAENESDITYPYVVNTIKELSRKYKIYIVSNCHDGYIELTARKNKITEYISDFECYGHNGKAKAENISLLVKRNNLNFPVYVGDTEGDMEACQEAGVPFIWAAYGFGKNLDEDKLAGKIEVFSDLLKLVD